jgi:hypothetical protein
MTEGSESEWLFASPVIWALSEYIFDVFDSKFQ